MSNEYYTPSGVPASNSDVTSNPIRSEFVAMSAGLDKLPVMGGNVGKIVYIQSASQLSSSTPGGLGLALQTDLTAETSARISDVDSEEAARIAADELLVTLATVQTITGRKVFAPTGLGPGNVEVEVQSNQTGVYVDMAGANSNGILIDTDIATGNSLVQFRYTNSTPVSVGSITTSSTTTSYNTTSDYRLKDNVLPLANCWDTVLALNPVEFTWKTNGYRDHGFIAHEVQSVIPNSVAGDKDGVDDDGLPLYQSMDAKFMIPFLVKAVQDLHARLRLLEGVQ